MLFIILSDILILFWKQLNYLEYKLKILANYIQAKEHKLRIVRSITNEPVETYFKIILVTFLLSRLQLDFMSFQNITQNPDINFVALPVGSHQSTYEKDHTLSLVVSLNKLNFLYIVSRRPKQITQRSKPSKL